MKIFAVYFRVNLTEKPEWFKDFRKKYDDPYDLHLTLIQPRYIDESKIDELRVKVDDFFDKNKLLEKDYLVDFDKFIFDPKPEDKYTLMLEFEEADHLVGFQKSLRDKLKGFGEYTKEIAAQYESNFKPHITFGRNVSREIFDEISYYFQSGKSVKCDINQAVLTVVKNDSVEEAMNSENLTVFNL